MSLTEQEAFMQDDVWNKVIPILKNQSEQMVEIAFGRYKTSYLLIKREIVEQVGELNKHPYLSQEALKSGYSRVEQKERALTNQFKTDLVVLEDLKQTFDGEPQLERIIDETVKNVHDIHSYMTYHHPTLKEIGHGIEKISSPNQKLGKQSDLSAESTVGTPGKQI